MGCTVLSVQICDWSNYFNYNVTKWFTQSSIQSQQLSKSQVWLNHQPQTCSMCSWTQNDLQRDSKSYFIFVCLLRVIEINLNDHYAGAKIDFHKNVFQKLSIQQFKPKIGHITLTICEDVRQFWIGYSWELFVVFQWCKKNYYMFSWK